jgi:hypothetical protein
MRTGHLPGWTAGEHQPQQQYPVTVTVAVTACQPGAPEQARQLQQHVTATPRVRDDATVSWAETTT